MVNRPAQDLPFATTPEEAPARSLADVMALVTADPTLTPTQRRDRLSALRTLARIFGQDPRLIAAVPGEVAARLRTLIPGAHGISQARLSAILSRLLAAFARAGIAVMPARSQTELSPEWQELEQALPTRRGRIGLSRFMRFCTRQGIAPDRVDATVFDRFRSALATESLAKRPDRLHRTVCKEWNEAAQIISDWPTVVLEVQHTKRYYSFPLSNFPESFTADVEAFLSHAGSPDPFDDDYARPVHPARW